MSTSKRTRASKLPLFTFAIGILLGRNLCMMPLLAPSIATRDDPTSPSPETGNHVVFKKDHLKRTMSMPQVRCNYRAPDRTCEGIFEYAPPNTNKTSSTEILQKEARQYTYGGEKRKDMIYFPTNFTTPEECTQQWRNNQHKYKDNGMSAWREDITIYETFFSSDDKFKHAGFYMEIGAHNGVRESNSRYFDVCLGWNGLLVEANSRNYLRMVKLRPTAHHLCVAPSCRTPSVVSFPLHLFTHGRMNEEGNLLEIHCEPLSWSLEQLDIRHIDFWSLDVEGVEKRVLETVDFDLVQIDVIMAESENRIAAKAESALEVRIFLQEKGYVLLDKSVSVYKSDVFLHKRACPRYPFIECNQKPL